MHVHGTKERLDEFLKFMTEYDENGKPVDDFSFQNVIPRPKELDVECGSIGDFGYAAFFSENSNDWKRILTYPWVIEKGITTREQLQAYFRNEDPKYEELGRIYYENIKKYGYHGWYGWNCDHWGTKWGACHVHVDREADDRVYIRFDTAWSFPEPIFNKLFEQFDDLDFVGTIDEEGGFFYGNLTGHSMEFFDGVRPGNEWIDEEEDDEEIETPGHTRKLTIPEEEV